ncbi:hypothetical protein D9757_001969 [Collybiopsis confluens]|uniref:Uncharacterized protein n=1 Tax=Collybiopsis confluens TaxID=2823264 RepID=A0A8H5HXI4_9AGAR|nr:hypothetical protein D9757_001969 [Collybiopsis confluens]
MHPSSVLCWPLPSNSIQRDSPSSRLQSPFQLASPAQIIETPASGSSSRPSQRRRHCLRTDCPIQSSSSSTHSFDSLSWISLMDSSPEEHGLTDIADLSQLPDHSSSAAGPVRRRKISFHRTSPLRAASGSSKQSAHLSSILRQRPIPTPSSPRPRFARSPIIFHDLMPLFTCDTRNSTPSSATY